MSTQDIDNLNVNGFDNFNFSKLLTAMDLALKLNSHHNNSSTLTHNERIFKNSFEFYYSSTLIAGNIFQDLINNITKSSSGNTQMSLSEDRFLNITWENKDNTCYLKLINLTDFNVTKIPIEVILFSAKNNNIPTLANLQKAIYKLENMAEYIVNSYDQEISIRMFNFSNPPINLKKEYNSLHDHDMLRLEQILQTIKYCINRLQHTTTIDNILVKISDIDSFQPILLFFQYINDISTQIETKIKHNLTTINNMIQ